MNITPIDMQVIIPKATEVGKGQQQRDQQNVFQQQYGAVQFQEEAHQKLRQVRNIEKSEGKKIKEDGNRKKHQGGGNSDNNSNADSQVLEPQKMLKDAIRGGHIDIKL